jgi:hypothetical protein
MALTHGLSTSRISLSNLAMGKSSDFGFSSGLDGADCPLLALGGHVSSCEFPDSLKQKNRLNNFRFSELKSWIG